MGVNARAIAHAQLPHAVQSAAALAGGRSAPPKHTDTDTQIQTQTQTQTQAQAQAQAHAQAQTERGGEREKAGFKTRQATAHLET